MKKYFSKALMFGALAVTALVGFSQSAKAAADEQLTALTASSSSFVTDNLGLIMTFISSNFFKIVGAGVGILALYWVARKIYSLMRR